MADAVLEGRAENESRLAKEGAAAEAAVAVSEYPQEVPVASSLVEIEEAMLEAAAAHTASAQGDPGWEPDETELMGETPKPAAEPAEEPALEPYREEPTSEVELT